MLFSTLLIGLLDLKVWSDMEGFRRMPRGTSGQLKEDRDKKAREIREKWLGKAYFFGPKSPASTSAIKKVSIRFILVVLIF